MPFQISPGVNVTEKDLTNIVPAVATTIGGIAGYFNWGPADERVLVDSEDNLVALFGKPDNNNAEQWWTAANFLGYANALQAVRVVNSSALNAVAFTSGRGDSGDPFSTGILIKNRDAYITAIDGGITAGADSDGLETGDDVCWAAKYPGDLGNSLKVSVSDKHERIFGGGGVAGSISGVTAISGNSYIGLTGAGGAHGGWQVNHTVNRPTIFQEVAVGDSIKLVSGSYTVTGFSGASAGVDSAEIIVGGGVTANHTAEGVFYSHILLDSAIAAADASASGGGTATVKWAYSGNFAATPDTSTDAAKFQAVNDEVDIAVIDEDGLFSGAAGTVLETFSASKAKDAKKFDGSGNYYVNAINEGSKYIWWGDHPDHLGPNITGLSGGIGSGGRPWGTLLTNIDTSTTEDGGSGFTFGSLRRNTYFTLQGGTDGTGFTNTGLYADGYDHFQDAETVDVNLILGGNAQSTVGGQLIDLVDARKDAIAFLSPLRADVVDKTPTVAQENAVNYYNNTLNKSSSYGVFDSGWKYQYDRYSDMYRWIPLNGDVAGLCARTELTNDAWWSPAGFNRGQIRNIVKLAYNPRKAHRDNLYKNNLNPVVAFPGEGTVLFGDKTMQRKPSAFDRINVRRLFIVLEKAIATAAKYQLFEFNDEFTRSNFVNMVTPFLRDVQGRRGIYDFRVVCDETNNTGEVIDRNEFVADIFIKPARSINFIQLNFVAVRTGVAFEEIAGA
jgi:hypothetical protein|tara:strand:- start:2178 stop:4361 length:2184 start_codon:yes stop_codon:yes gene_type:complete